LFADGRFGVLEKMGLNSIFSRRTYTLVYLTFIAFGLEGCKSRVAVDSGFVEDRWSKTMGYYNFSAAFPPRDVMPGDIFLAFQKNPGQTPNPASPEIHTDRPPFFYRLTRLDVKTIIKNDLLKRINLPQTAQGTSDKPVDIFSTQKNITALPTAAFIGYNIVNITEGDAGVAFPVHLFRTFLGGAFEDQLALSISVPSAQLVELPAIDAFHVLSNYCHNKNTKQYCEKPDWTAIDESITSDPITFIVKQYVDQFSINKDDYDLALIFVTDVLYAQSIQYSYSTENGSAFSAAVTPIASLSSQTKASGATATSQTASEGGTTINVTGGTATATNGGATACTAPAAKADPTPTDPKTPETPKKPDTEALEQSVAEAEAAAKSAQDAETTANTNLTSAQSDIAKATGALENATTVEQKKLAAALKAAEAKLPTAQTAADTAKDVTSTAEKTLINDQKALAAALKTAEQPAAAPAAPAPPAAAAAPAPKPAAMDKSAAQDNGCQTNKQPGNVAPNPAADAEARIQALEAKVSALNQQLGPVGGTVTIASVSEQGTVLQQTFPSPVAIGYRGFDLDLLPRSGGQMTPTRK
jgi:hypothetical protein